MREPALLIVRRSLKNLLRNPAPALTGLGMSLFFLVVYDASIGGIGFLPEFHGMGYLAYLLPMGVVSLLFASSAGAGQAVSRDIASGYLLRLALAPVPRWSFVMAAVLADALAIFASSLLVIGVGTLLGAPVGNGALSALPAAVSCAVLAALLGAGISAFSSALVLRTEKVELAGTVGSCLFVLLFLAPTFVPERLMGAVWLRTVAKANPLTYVMDAMRELLTGTGSSASVPLAFAFALMCGIGGTLLACGSVRRVLR